MALYALGWGTGRYLYEMSPTSCFYLTFAMGGVQAPNGVGFQYLGRVLYLCDFLDNTAPSGLESASSFSHQHRVGVLTADQGHSKDYVSDGMARGHLEIPDTSKYHRDGPSSLAFYFRFACYECMAADSSRFLNSRLSYKC